MQVLFLIIICFFMFVNSSTYLDIYLTCCKTYVILEHGKDNCATKVSLYAQDMSHVYPLVHIRQSGTFNDNVCSPNCHCPTCSDNLIKLKRDTPVKPEYDRKKKSLSMTK